MPIAGVLPRVAGNLERPADPTGSNDDSGSLEKHELAGIPLVAECAGDPAILPLARKQDVSDRALREDPQTRLVIIADLLIFLLQPYNFLLPCAD